jgi:hypothetical protein
MHPSYRDTGLAAGAPKNALVGTEGAFGNTAAHKFRQLEYVARRYRIALPVAAVIVEHAFGNGGRR